MVVNEKRVAVIHNLLTTVGQKKHIKYTLGRKHWTEKHIGLMKRSLSKDRFASWYKEYVKQIDGN